jgi:hypothetical protein
MFHLADMYIQKLSDQATAGGFKLGLIKMCDPIFRILALSHECIGSDIHMLN